METVMRDVKVEMNSNHSIGYRMKKLRERRGWTQKYVAQKVGKTQSTYAGWENEARTPPTEVMPLIAEKLETTLDYLYGLTDDPSGTANSTEIKSMQEEAIFSLLGIDYEEAKSLMPPSVREEMIDFYKYKLSKELEKKTERTNK
ncbi:helix-turn-helix transcriptional regulator [uncultured Exiguobacterium sp.]|uniref:helix-turn-helix domain-containing protein n=1 Tax=uncultured Exiguobacterium sp. TaxID=202669 RepID=UPI0025ECAF6C|nr:helix-turn-helix transcriptional regulator [uncultured Exiguobacterium sp.]